MKKIFKSIESTEIAQQDTLPDTYELAPSDLEQVSGGIGTVTVAGPTP